MRPPRLAEWIVERSLPADPAERDAILGDLAEEYAEQAVLAGGGRASAWYWRQTLTSIGPNLHRRLTRPRNRRADASKGDTMDSIGQDIRYGWRRLQAPASFCADFSVSKCAVSSSRPERSR